jgi:hypothetical protein
MYRNVLHSKYLKFKISLIDNSNFNIRYGTDNKNKNEIFPQYVTVYNMAHKVIIP